MPPTLPSLPGGLNPALILVAGGTGTRMGAGRPKQFLPLAGVPVIIRSLAAFAQAYPGMPAVVVMHPGSMTAWQRMARRHAPTLPLQLHTVPGGAERTDSVRAGLLAWQQLWAPQPGQWLVAVHDAVRPLATPQLIRDAYAAAALHGSAVCAVPSKASLRQRHPDGSSTAVDRELYLAVQTPQIFGGQVLLEAYQRQLAHYPDERFTDDASLVERTGHPVHLCPGSYANLKITTPEDMVVARQLLRAGQ